MVSMRTANPQQLNKKGRNKRVARVAQKAVTEVTDLEVKALIPQEEDNPGRLMDMHVAAGAVYIGEINHQPVEETKAKNEAEG